MVTKSTSASIKIYLVTYKCTLQGPNVPSTHDLDIMYVNLTTRACTRDAAGPRPGRYRGRMREEGGGGGGGEAPFWAGPGG